MMQTYRLFVA